MEKITESQNKPRFNLIDLAIVLAVICVIAGTVFRYFVDYREKETVILEDTELTLLIEGMDNGISGGIAQGKTVYLDGTAIGTVKTADLSRAETFYTAQDGTVKVAYSSEKCDIRFVLSVKGCETDDGFQLSGTVPLAPGQTLTLRTDTQTFSALVTDITYLR